MSRSSSSSAVCESNIIDLLPVGKPVEQPPHYSILDTPMDSSLINGSQLNELVYDVRGAVEHLKHHPHAHRSVQNFVARQFGTTHLKNLKKAHYEPAKVFIERLRLIFIDHSTSLWSLEGRFLHDIFGEKESSNG